MFRKRKGTSGISGQLYESKLISLLYFRAIHDNRIAEFQLASNVDSIGAFDDICFKAKVEGLDKPVLVFIQAKHRENEKQTLTVDLATYFYSYLKIRHTFDSSNNDLLFIGAFDKTECLFVIYTTARDEFCNEKKVESRFFSNLYDLICTGGTVKQPDKPEENVEFLSKIAVKDQITSLAQRIAEFIMREENFQMMSDELVQRYHVILAQKVVDVSEIQPDGQRIAFFRHSFFNTNEEYLILFKDTLYKEILKRRKIKPADVTNLLSEFLANPTDAIKLSKLIGTVITYNNGQLELLKPSTKDGNQQLNQAVSRLTVDQAVEMAAKEILSQEFKVPAAFGNKDITIRGSDAKIEKRMNHITTRIKDLLEKCDASKIVTIDDSLEKGLQKLNGGIAGAIGNIFVLDKDTKLMKVTDKCESLGDDAKRLYKKIIEKIPNFQEYKFSFKIYKQFPKLSFDRTEYEENLAKDFLNKLLFYSSQANENGVEKILKREIEYYQRNHANSFKAKTDAIFSKYHDDIQKWWMQANEVDYLTKDINKFENAIHNISKDPLISAIKVTYMSKIKHFNYTFNEDAVKSLNMQDQLSTTIIITDNIVPTVVKVMQYLKDKEHTVLDLEYIVDLPRNDRNALSRELKNTNKDNVLIIVCDKIPTPAHEKNTLENITKAIQDKKTIVITNKMSPAVLKEYFPKAVNIVHDEKTTLIDMSEESQKSILESASLIFQGKVVKLSLIVDGETMACIKGDVLNKIVSKETIEVSEQIVNRNYEEIKHFYVERSVRKAGCVSVVRTLNDIADDVVVVTAEPGMGKSNLLTHLSLKTKEVAPEVWIVRVNLLEYSREFSKWKEDETTIDTLETLKFMCQVILRRKVDKENKVEIALQKQNNVVYLKHCTGDQWTVFELKLFLNFYNKRKIIFLFDGFDEVCPHYTNEVIKCIKTFSNDSRQHRMWITSRSYNEVKTILEQEFGSSYEIDCFSSTETETYLEKYWEFNLRLEEFNSIQLENVKNFIEHVILKLDENLDTLLTPVHRVYINAAQYLINEINNKFIPLWTFKKKYDDCAIRQYLEIAREYDQDGTCYYSPVKNDGNPLHLFLAAVFVEGYLKSINKKSKKWSHEVSIFAFCERFLQSMVKIRFEEKNEMNIYYPDLINTYDKEFADFILRHKKMAAYAIFNKHVHHCKLLLSMKDLGEIKKTMKFLEKGGDKTGLIYSVAYEIPIFIHRTFAEYLAVEHVCDCIKKQKNRKKQISLIHFVMIDIFLYYPRTSYMCAVFNNKVKVDKTLMSILENNKVIIFNLLMDLRQPYSLLHMVFMADLHNFILLFVKILEYYVNKSNLNDFLDFIKKSELLSLPTTIENTVMKSVFDIVRKIDESKFSSIGEFQKLFIT